MGKKYLLDQCVREEFLQLVKKAGNNQKKREEARKLVYSRMCGRKVDGVRWWNANREALKDEMKELEARVAA